MTKKKTVKKKAKKVTAHVREEALCSCGKPFNDHIEIAPTFHLLCNGNVGKT